MYVFIHAWFQMAIECKVCENSLSATVLSVTTVSAYSTLELEFSEFKLIITSWE